MLVTLRDWTGYRLSDNCALSCRWSTGPLSACGCGRPCRTDCGLLKHDDLKWFIRAGFVVGQIKGWKEKLAAGIVLAVSSLREGPRPDRVAITPQARSAGHLVFRGPVYTKAFAESGLHL